MTETTDRRKSFLTANRGMIIIFSKLKSIELLTFVGLLGSFIWYFSLTYLMVL